VRSVRTNYARSRVQPFQTRTKLCGSRLRACQKDFFDKLNCRALKPERGSDRLCGGLTDPFPF
jgi:hypothetical protein